MMLRLLKTAAYGVSAGAIFLALLYAFNIGDVRAVFRPVPDPGGILIIFGGLSLIFVGVGMLLARLGDGEPSL